MAADISTTLQEHITTKIRGLGLIPIPVTDSTDPDDNEGIVFDGSIDEFLQTIVELKERAVFVAVKLFSDEELQRALNYTDEIEGISLRKFLKNIESVRNHVGEECELRLTVRTQAFELNFYHSESWWDDHINNLSDALGEFEEVVSRQREEEANNASNQRTKVFKGINELIRDDNFVHLPTQRAMVAYAMDSVEGIEILSEDELKSEVQKLNDKLIARGLRK